MRDDPKGQDVFLNEVTERAKRSGATEARIALIRNGADSFGELTRTQPGRASFKAELLAKGYAENNLGQWVVDSYKNEVMAAYRSPNGIPVRFIPMSLSELEAAHAALPLHGMLGTGGAYMDKDSTAGGTQGWDQFARLATVLPYGGNSAFVHPQGPDKTGIPPARGDSVLDPGEGILPFTTASHVGSKEGWVMSRNENLSVVCNMFEVLAANGQEMALGITPGAVVRVTPEAITLVRANPHPATKEPAGEAFIYLRAGATGDELQAKSTTALASGGACAPDGVHLVALRDVGQRFSY